MAASTGHSVLRGPAPFVWSLAGLLVARLGLQIAVHLAGFRALTADDFGRVIAAARWAQHPTAIWNGPWLPLYTYAMGLVLRVIWDLYYVPRLLAAAAGLVSIIVVALLTTRLFHSRTAGLLAGLLLALNPAHLWLSQVPLTEIFFFALVAGAVLAVVVWAQTQRGRWLAVAGLLLALASGTRVEGWIFSAVLGVALSGAALWRFRRGERRPPRLMLLTAGGLAVVPLTWIVSNWATTHDPLYFLNVTRGFDSQWYGVSYTYAPFLAVAARLDPLTMVLLPVAVIVGGLVARHNSALRWYLWLALVPFGVYALFQRGQVQPPGNYVRYVGVFLFLAYPLVAGLSARLVAWRPPWQPWTTAGLALVLCVAAARQVQTALHYTNDPAADGLAVGQWLRAAGLDSSGPTGLLEVSYWQYLAIHTGANDLSHLLYDRPLDLAHLNETRSSLLGHPEVLRACVATYPLKYIAVWSPDLRTLVETTLNLTPAAEINGYALYRLIMPRPDVPAGVECPLPLGTGY